jgi:type I restriction enzyme, S subunit
LWSHLVHFGQMVLYKKYDLHQDYIRTRRHQIHILRYARERFWPKRGAAQPFISQTDARNTTLLIPPIEHQRRTAAILSAYDDLIENNIRRIAILEEMARALYQEWFVHFRFPGYEHVPLVDSPLGPIPQGWEVGELQDALVLQRGFDLPLKEREAGPIPVYASTGIVGTHSEAKVRGPGVVTGRSGSLGTVIYCPKEFWPLNTTLWVKEYRRSTPFHAFYLLQGLGLEKYDGGAAVPTLNRNHVHGLPTVLPPLSFLERFDEVLLPTYDLKFVLDAKNQNLRTTRDLLLPKLISGEIDVSAMLEEPIPEAAD